MRLPGLPVQIIAPLAAVVLLAAQWGGTCTGCGRPISLFAVLTGAPLDCCPSGDTGSDREAPEPCEHCQHCTHDGEQGDSEHGHGHEAPGQRDDSPCHCPKVIGIDLATGAVDVVVVEEPATHLSVDASVHAPSADSSVAVAGPPARRAHGPPADGPSLSAVLCVWRN